MSHRQEISYKVSTCLVESQGSRDSSQYHLVPEKAVQNISIQVKKGDTFGLVKDKIYKNTAENSSNYQSPNVWY